MAEVTVRHELGCSAEEYWDKCIFDEGFNRALYVGHLHFHGVESVESRDVGDRRTKKATISPSLAGFPGPVKKLAGDALKYSEDGYLDKKTGRYHAKITPSTLADKTHVESELWCEPSPTGDANRCVRVARVKVEVKLFGLGSLVEEKIMRDIHASYDAEAACVAEWVKR
jgi:hypothetical protein